MVSTILAYFYITSSILYYFPHNVRSSICRIRIKQFSFFFFYRATERLYQTQSWKESGVLIEHQPHHGLIFVRPPPIPLPLHSPSPPRFAFNHTKPPGNEPLPSVGLNLNFTAHSQMRTCCIRPSPFQRDVGRFILI